MHDERSFLSMISADPSDPTRRLVYADWLEERGDPRSELVRLQARLMHRSPGDPEWPALKAREEELRHQCPAYWLAILDPPVWCLVGNIVSEHSSGPGGQDPRRGTRLFRPNTKIYLAETRHCWGLLNPAAGRDTAMQVVGQHRKSRKWILSWVRASYTTNWRVRLVHHPGALIRLREAGWPGFLLTPGEFSCCEDRQSPELIRAFLEAVWAVQRREWENRHRATEWGA